ncbi:hypothetical protein MN116_002813 [Schistosoma mekongi]|uniref:Uncharacterized protein n=1 Tax=Schistosoma mekongi TaxID=38744 RepID=A0AAE1ZHG6_SCHME|nr:hypothetical protein MN116_002813 [Schistosoma mekongi]
MFNNSSSPQRYPWNTYGSSPNSDHSYRGRFNSHHRSPITSTPPFGGERFPQSPQDFLPHWSPPVCYPSCYISSPSARYGTPNFNQPYCHRAFDSTVNSCGASRSPYASNYNSPMNVHSTSICSSFLVTSPDNLSWNCDTHCNSSTFDTSLSSPGNSCRKVNENNRSVKNWIASSLSNPWEGMKPIRTPQSGCLVDKPPAQRHTVLFAPHERRRKLDIDDDEAVTVSPTKQLQRVCSD